MPYCKKILLLGGGGHCLSVIDTLKGLNSYNTIGIIEKEMEEKNPPKRTLGVSVMGTDEDLEKFYQEGFTDAFVTVGSIGDISLRQKLYKRMKEIGFHIPNIIDRASVVSDETAMGEGIYIGKGAVINAGVAIGNMAIINTASVIEHECRIGEFVHVAPRSVLCGNVYIGNGSHVGAGSVVKQGVQVGANTMIGMGSVVLHNMGDNATAYGNPCVERKSG